MSVVDFLQKYNHKLLVLFLLIKITFIINCQFICQPSETSGQFWFLMQGPRTTDAQWSPFSPKSHTFGLGQTIWADKFWGIWGIFGQFINTHFGTVSPLSMFFMFSINQPLFLQKSKPLYLNPKYLFGPQRIRDLVIVCPYLVRGRGGGINSNMST